MAEENAGSRTAIWAALITTVGAIMVAAITALASSHSSSESAPTAAARASTTSTPSDSPAGPSPGAVLTAAESDLFKKLLPSHVLLSSCAPFSYLEQKGASAAIQCSARPLLSNSVVFASYPSTTAMDEDGLGLYSQSRSGSGNCAKGQFYNGIWDLPAGTVAGDEVCTTLSGSYYVVSGFNSSAIMVVVVDARPQNAYNWWNEYIGGLFVS